MTTMESSWKVLRTFPPLVLCVVQLFWITTQQTNSRAYKYTIINKNEMSLMTASTTTAARSNTSTTTVSLRRQRRKRTTTTVSRAMMNLRFDDDDGKKNSNDEEKTMSKRQFALSTAAAVASVVLSLGQPMDAQALSLKSSNKNGVYWIEPKVFIV